MQRQKTKTEQHGLFEKKKRPKSCFDCFPRCCFIVSQLKAKCFSQFMLKLQRHFWKIFFCKEQGEEGSVNCSDWHVSLKTFFSLSFVLFLAFSFFSCFYILQGGKGRGNVNWSDWQSLLRFFSCFFLSFSCFSSLFHRFFLPFVSIFCKFQRGEGRGKCQLQWLARFVENLQNRD